MNKEKTLLCFFALQFCFICFNLVFVEPKNASVTHLCFRDESIALLQLKQSFTMDSLGITSSWNSNTDCCHWGGVLCDPTTNHVTSLDISSSGIVGTIGNNSTLFLLHHLETLNLAFNNFSGSAMSPKFGQFSYLKHLNLSLSYFSSAVVVPQEIGKLSKLETLDLSGNTLKMPKFDKIISNMTGLKRLDLGDTFFDSTVFPTLTNLSSLEYVALYHCKLQEELPFSILNLPHLEYLDVGDNSAVYANFRLYNWSSPLQYLDLTSVNFSSQIPTLPGRAPYKLLRELYLSWCNLQGEVPSWILTNPNLFRIRISTNQLTGVASKFLRDITSAELQILDLDANNFTGNISLYNIYQKFPNLLFLILSNNNLFVTTRPESVTSLSQWPMIITLGLSSCNLNEIPDLLKNQSFLDDLDLSNNNIHGKIPNWLLREGKYSLQGLDLSNNFFTGSLENLPWEGLKSIDLSSNMFHGALPIPPLKMIWFATSNNNFTGPIDSSICNLSVLMVLDLSNNSLGGGLPECLWNMSNVLIVLNLGSNKLVGNLSLNFTQCPLLQYLDLSENGLQGPVSRSLARCTSLQLVNLRSNKVKDEFPIWLHNLPQIQVIDLSFNGLYGSITHVNNNSFSALQILDLSSNTLVGEIPATYLKGFKAMMNISQDGQRYMGSGVVSQSHHGYTYSMTISIGGVQRKYQKIITTLTTLDLSNNGFIGHIPDCVGDLVMIHSLNLSHNKITGKIPSSIGNLTMINSLDLSGNKLDGKIPLELASLTSMGVFNVSNNQLVGQIPQSNNFDTLFQADSYEHNLGLCGFPLPECSTGLAGASTRNSEHEGSGNGSVFGLTFWKITLISYGCGTVLGLAWGYYWLSSGNLFMLTKIAFLIETKISGYFRKVKNQRRKRSRRAANQFP